MGRKQRAARAAAAAAAAGASGGEPAARKASTGKKARRAARAERRQLEKANLARISGSVAGRGDGPTVFCDLDGVLVDFDGGFEVLFGGRPDTFDVDSMWARAAGTPDYFEHLPWMPDGQLLWSAIAALPAVILTGCPRGEWAAPQKQAWCARELGPRVQVITTQSRAKSRYCRPGDVLIDDRYTARKAWVKAGGVFVHHVSAEDSLAQLRALGVIGEAPPGLGRALFMRAISDDG